MTEENLWVKEENGVATVLQAAVNNNKKKAVYESVLRFQQWLFDNIKKD